jgi:hypothetical protein
MRVNPLAAVLALLVLLDPAVAGAADATDDWNARAIAAMTIAKRTQVAGFIDVAIVQAAVYDALNAIDGGAFRPYASRPRVDRGASMDAAAAQASHDVLVFLYPAQAGDLDAALAASLAIIADGPAKADGVGAGAAAAAALIARRVNDGRDAPIGYTPGTGPGVWQPTPPAFLAAQTPWVAFVQPFTMRAPSQFRPGPPPPLASDKWEDAFNEVKVRGALVGSNRTPQETLQALFWTDNAPTQYNRYLRRLAAEQHLAPADKARLYAEINMAAADGGIACFDGKYAYGFWRPVTAIPAADTDDNAATVADPGWLPAVVTPNHPEYPSAHACVSGAIAETLAAFFGTDVVTSTIDSAVTNTSAEFASFSDLYQYVHEARILGGLHYRFSMKAGRRVGRGVSLQLTRRYFNPVRPEDRDEDGSSERRER